VAISYYFAAMKKCILAAILMASTMLVNAQVLLGVTGGPTFTSQRWLSNAELYGGTKTRTQFQLGITSDLPIAQKWSLQPEVLFSYEGWRNTQEVSNLLNEYTNNIGYIKTPILLSYLKEYDGAFGILGAGPYISGVAITNQTFLQNNVNLGSGKLRLGTTEDDQYTKLDYGIRFKTSFLLKNNLGFGANYDLGLKDINPTMIKTFNRSFGISLNYFFRITEQDMFQRYSDSYKW
jgi:hypothetical protein